MVASWGFLSLIVVLRNFPPQVTKNVPHCAPFIAFCRCRVQAREVLFGGSVGSGKTDAILMAALSQVDNKHHQALILRRTFPMLRDLIGRSHELFLPLRARFNRQESVWTFPSGARVEFGFLDADEDKYRYMDRQFSMLGWDELARRFHRRTRQAGQLGLCLYAVTIASR